MTTLTYENIASKLVEWVPELAIIYNHEINYYGEISNYVFFGSLLTNFILSSIERESELKHIERIFEFIEQCALSSDKEILDVISVGFLENIIPYTIPPYIHSQTILGYMKPETKLMRSKFGIP